MMPYCIMIYFSLPYLVQSMQNILSACVTTGLDLWDHLMDRTNQSVSNDQYDGERQMRG